MSILDRYIDRNRDEKRRKRLREATSRMSHAEDRLLDGLGLDIGNGGATEGSAQNSEDNGSDDTLEGGSPDGEQTEEG